MINSPSVNDSRSRLADWLELIILTGGTVAGESDVVKLLRIEGDERHPGNDELVANENEPEIEELAKEALLDRVAEEISFRATCLGSVYPFELVAPGLLVRLKPHEANYSAARAAYCFCLLMTTARDGITGGNDEFAAAVREGRRLFHLCACVGVAGLIGSGHAVWFGFPRPTKTGFAAALGELVRTLGFGKIKDPPPLGLPVAAKDDQIDVVGWRPYADKRVSTLVVLCQAATGNDWDDKSVVPHVQAFSDWFEHPIYGSAMTALAVPASAHHDIDEPPEHSAGTYEDAVQGGLKRLSHRHGVLLDRIRISQSVQEVGDGPARRLRVPQWDRMAEISAWVSNTIRLVA